MAEQTRASITIDAEPRAIMDVIADFESYPEWSDVRAVEVRERGPDGRPRLVHFEIQSGPVNARYTLEYDYDPEDRGVSWRFVDGSGIKDLFGSYVLEPDGASTTVTYSLTVDINIPGPGFLKRKLVAEGEKRIIDMALKGLKRRVESRA